LTPAKGVELNRPLKETMEAGLIRSSHGEFGSPILVRKDYSSLHVCIDRRAFN
jgi:hypothetical protein